MTLAKANINVKSGIIELEGPVEFVREYLERYSPTGNGQPVHKAKVARVNKVRMRATREKTVKAKAVRKKKLPVTKPKVIEAVTIPAKPVRQKVSKPPKIMAAGKRGRNTLARMVNADIYSGFFNRPISIKEVDDRLKEKGVSYSRAMIKTGLKKVIAEGKLESMGKGRGMVYITKIEAEAPPADLS